MQVYIPLNEPRGRNSGIDMSNRKMRRLILSGSLIFSLASWNALHARQAGPFEVASIKQTVSPLGVTGGCRAIDSKLAPTDSATTSRWGAAWDSSSFR